MFKTKMHVLSFALFLAGFMVVCANANDQTAKNPEYSRNLPTQENSILHDPIEDDPKYKDVFETIDDEVNERLKDHPLRGSMGFCHIFWETKKEILKRNYGIRWRSPAEMNPHIMFD